MKMKFPLYLGVWLVVAVSSTVLSVLVYTATQQNLRLSANSAPASAVNAIANILKQGASPDQIIPPAQTELAQNFSVFAIIFDANAKVLASSVAVDGKTPSLPSGVFDTAKKKGESRFTWMPQPGVREAVVVKSVSVNSQSTSTPGAGYILAGQSLSETERIIQSITMLAGIGWALLMILSFAAAWLFVGKNEQHHREHQEHSHETAA